MTDQVIKKAHVESDDVMASILAAMACIERVPASTTLIDTISEEEWHSDEVSDWNILVGSDTVDQADEADCFDAIVPEVA